MEEVLRKPHFKIILANKIQEGGRLQALVLIVQITWDILFHKSQVKEVLTICLETTL